MSCSRLVLWTISVAFGLVLAVTRARASESGALEADPSFLSDLLGLSGSVRMAEFSKDKSYSDETGYTVGSVWVTAAPKAFWGIRTYFDARAQDQDLGRSGSSVSLELREAYAQGAFGRLDLRVGRQIIVWGRADKINPTDSWSTRDFTLLAPNDDDQRLGVTTVQATWNAGAYRIISLWQPEWRFPVLPIPPQPPGVSLLNLAPTDPAKQWGIKVDHSGDGLDWSLSYARSLDRTPDLSIVSEGPQGLSLGLSYHPISVLGADAAVPVGKFGLRAEVAYTRTENPDGTDPLTQRRNLFAVLGCERTFGGVLNINAQYLYRRVFNFVSPFTIQSPETRQLAEQVDLLSNQLAANMQGASLRINYKAWNETLEGEVSAVTWFTKGDSAIFPKVTYAFSDRLKGIIGGELYHGPRQSFFGQLNPTSTAYAELQVGF
jgi:hypothetical protein